MKLKNIYYTYELDEIKPVFAQAGVVAKQVYNHVYEDPNDETKNKALALVAKRATNITIIHSPYRTFLHSCLKQELSDKEKHTLAETQEAFKKCVLKWKEMKK